MGGRPSYVDGTLRHRRGVYDNAHERTKGHERHTEDEIEEIAFPGMADLLARFQREVEALPP